MTHKSSTSAFSSKNCPSVFKKPGFLSVLGRIIMLPFTLLSYGALLLIGLFITFSAWFCSLFTKSPSWHNFREDTLLEDFSSKETPVFMAGTIDISMLLYRMRALWITPPALILLITIILYASFSDFKSISQFVYTLDSAIITQERNQP
jgi:hypothetical protein